MLAAILTDIEGTTSRIDFVHKVLFPYARQHLARFVGSHINDGQVASQIEAVRQDIGEPHASVARVIEILTEWMDQDRKITALKILQGMIWKQAYTAGHFTAHIYADAVDALRYWHQQGLKLYVYSSGSVAAQKLFFRYSVFGDLTPLFSGYFDTVTGGKREVESYARIAQEIGKAPPDILFLSDIEAELDAAKVAGMKTVQLLRADAMPQSHGHHFTAATFANVDSLIRNREYEISVPSNA